MERNTRMVCYERVWLLGTKTTFVSICDAVYIPWHSVDADLSEPPLLNLSDTVNDECRQTGNSGGAEGC